MMPRSHRDPFSNNIDFWHGFAVAFMVSTSLSNLKSPHGIEQNQSPNGFCT